MRIVSVEPIAVRLEQNREASERTAGSPTALRTSRERYRWSEAVNTLYSTCFETALVKLTTEDGVTGWGEAQAPLAPEVACTIVRELLRPVLLETDFDPCPDGIARLWHRMYAAMRVRGQTGGFMLDAISGVDIALWDIAGKYAGLPVAKLLAHSPDQTVTAYLSGVPGESAADRASTAAKRWAEGFRTFKLFHHASLTDLLATYDAIATIPQTRPAIAVDALWRLEPGSAAALASELDQRGALWLEAPFPPENVRAHADLAMHMRTPLALGESYRTVWELLPFFESRAVRLVQPDIGRTGVTEGVRIAREAAKRGFKVVPHVSIAMAPQIAAAIHFAAAVPNCSLLEFNPSVLAVANQYADTPLHFENARYSVPAGPGLGLSVLEEQLLEDLRAWNHGG